MFSQMLPPTQPVPGKAPPAQTPAVPPSHTHTSTPGPAGQPLLEPNSALPQAPVAGASISNFTGQVENASMKRKPGRPKGSGKKVADPQAPVKVKRPVGRPRKDGLPAGSVDARRPPPRQRKAPPGQFASGSVGSAASTPPGWNSIKWEHPRSVYAPGPLVGNRAPSISISAGPSGAPVVPLQAQSPSNEWATLLRTDEEAFLHNLVISLGPIAPSSTAREAFATHLKALKPNGGIPYLYSVVRTFWIPSSPAFFSLVSPSGTGRPVQTADRFFYWDPLPLIVMGLPCPGGCGGVLTNRGSIAHGVLAVHDLRGPYYIMGAEYVCSSAKCTAECGPDGRVLSSVDGSVTRALPPGLRREFPARLLNATHDRGARADSWNWAVCGVSEGVWDLVRAALRVGNSPDAILELVRCTRDGVPDDVIFVTKHERVPYESISAAPASARGASQAEAMEVEAALEESASALLP